MFVLKLNVKVFVLFLDLLSVDLSQLSLCHSLRLSVKRLSRESKLASSPRLVLCYTEVSLVSQHDRAF